MEGGGRECRKREGGGKGRWEGWREGDCEEIMKTETRRRRRRKREGESESKGGIDGRREGGKDFNLR